MEVDAVRAEIKQWERTFKTKHQRNPTVEDIKALPEIAARYKLYKKLIKESVVLHVPKKTNNIVPSTPPRRTTALPGPSSLVPKSRATAHSTTDATPNPFSPSKSSRAKLISLDEQHLPQPDFLKHPSTPPRKKRVYSTPSPEPAPSIESVPKATSPFANRAVKKARKRLRGDLVSPSPKKPRRASARLGSGSENDTDEGEADTSYIDDSPVKTSSNGKDFKALFEEGRVSQPDFRDKRGPFSRYKSVSDPFEDAMPSHLRSKEKDAPPKGTPPPQIHNKKLSELKEKQPVQAKKRVSIGKQSYAPKKSNLRDNSPDNESSEVQDSLPSNATRKRSSSIDADDSAAKNYSFSITNGGLLPPSPPPSTSQSKAREEVSKGHNKNRKKAKLTVSKGLDGDYTDDEDELQVVELVPKAQRNIISADDDDDTIRETFAFARKDRFANAPENREVSSDSGEPEVHLQENLRNVLHISSSHSREREELALVDSLLLGTHGPLDQRGEVWGIGECEDTTATTTDDDWAGEGLPWEVGEL